MLLEQAAAPLKSFSALIEDSDPDVANVLSPLVERLDADLKKIGAVVVNTLGEVKILVCDHPYMQVDKDFCLKDFVKALLEPKEARG